MRKIDKTKILSKQYKKWVDKLNHDKAKHPHNSKRPYYNDVVMNLLHCQKGVCAYTEKFLCSPELLSEDNWENGRYKLKKPGRFGQLEHFDPGLKEDKFWEWENLFVVHSDINRLKGDKKVDSILKPDSPEYDPMVLLEYNEKRHMFVPHTDIGDKAIRERIERMIETLRLNYSPLCCKRRKFLNMVFKLQEQDEPIEIYQFFTAYEMAAAARKEGEG